MMFRLFCLTLTLCRRNSWYCNRCHCNGGYKSFQNSVFMQEKGSRVVLIGQGEVEVRTYDRCPVSMIAVRFRQMYGRREEA